MIGTLIEFTESPYCRVPGRGNGGIVYPGDRFVATDAEYQVYVVQNGWAKNVETGEQGERTPGAKEMVIDSINQPLA